MYSSGAANWPSQTKYGVYRGKELSLAEKKKGGTLQPFDYWRARKESNPITSWFVAFCRAESPNIINHLRCGGPRIFSAP